jgi:hypothetical protein
MVESLVSHGLTHETIAQLLDISADTLTRHYRRELDTGEAKAVALMARSLFRRGLRGDTTAALFWLKAKGKWRDRDQMNVQVAQILPDNSSPKQDVKLIEDAVYSALARLRPAKDIGKAKLVTNQ